MKSIASLLLILVALSVPAFAADVDGTWTGTVVAPTGEFPVTFTFKANGETLTGTTMNFDGSPLNITEGKVSGNNITFKISFDLGGMPFVLNYKGVVSPTELKMTAEADQIPAIEFVLKKAPAAASPAPATR